MAEDLYAVIKDIIIGHLNVYFTNSKLSQPQKAVVAYFDGQSGIAMSSEVGQISFVGDARTPLVVGQSAVFVPLPNSTTYYAVGFV